MPGFEGVPDFPGPDDDLRRLEHATLGPLGFVSLAPDCPLTDLLDPVRERVGWLPIERLASAPASLEDYSVDASFLLYCDNYLEGFHIPFVHPGLARALQFDEYETRLLPHGSLQIASARDAEDAFELPAGHPDGGRRVAAWYFFLFPTTMLNVYPWGLSLNVILPQGPTATRVLFLSWVWDTSRRSRGAGADLGTVEREDEAIVRRVQHGVRSRLYPRGRYSPSQELGVHHFHRMLAARLNRQATRPAPA
jgi:choline monooxygenase